MIKTTNMLLEDLSSYSNPKTKLARLVKNGDCYRIVKGLYETDKNAPGFLLAGSIYGPSYISFEYALSFYGLIPEKVYEFTSATFEKRKSKRYITVFGVFSYKDIPSSAFPYFVFLNKEGDYHYRIASKEKALCDLLYVMPPCGNVGELKDLLFNDLRMDEEELRYFDLDAVNFLIDKYNSRNIKKFSSLLRRIQK